MTPLLAIIFTIAAIIFSGLFSGTEIAFVSSDKVKMEIAASRGGLFNRIVDSFRRRQDMFIATLLVGNNVVLVIYGITISILINPPLAALLHNDALVLLANTLISTGIILITGEFLPKTVFRINPNLMLRIFALPMVLIYIILYPVSALAFGISRGLMKLFGISTDKSDNSPLTIDQLDHYIQQSIDEQPGSAAVENEVKIFRNAIDFKDTQVGQCMVPRNEIIAVDIRDTTRQRLLRTFIETGLSKIIVYDEDIDNVVGYIHVSELFDSTNDWKQRLKPVIFTPESMLANKLMQRLLAEKRSLAVIVDEFGGTAGMVTLEDLVEEIFGEIEDEHDRNRLIARRNDDGSYEISGRAEIERINEDFHLGLRTSDEYHTLAGYILDNLEALPEKDQTIDIDSLRFTILRMSAARIELVKIQKIS